MDTYREIVVVTGMWDYPGLVIDARADIERKTCVAVAMFSLCKYKESVA